MRRYCKYILLLCAAFCLSGCGNVSELSFGRIESFLPSNISLTGMEMTAVLPATNSGSNNLSITDVEITCNSFSALKLVLSSPVIVHPGTESISVPLKLEYSGGSILSLLQVLRTIKNQKCACTAIVRYSSSNGMQRTLRYRKEISADSIRSLISDKF